jgi:hypothetical protein
MTVHCLGNGNICAYGRGTDVFDLAGPEYSSPKAFELESEFPGNRKEDVITKKLSHVAFCHEAAGGPNANDDAPMLRIIDFAPPGSFLFIRQIEGSAVITVRSPYGRFSPTHLGDTLMAETRPGNMIYTYMLEDGRPVGYPSARFRYAAMRATGDCRILFDPSEPLTAKVAVEGFGQLIFSFSFYMAEAFEIAAKYPQNVPFGGRKLFVGDKLLRPERELTVAPSHRYYREVCDAYDVIASQQSVHGGVLAGYNYRLIYVRDNYGVLRFLLAAGAHGRAKKMMEYYIGVFDRYGRIQNAQGAGEYAFHVHENDNAEITGYVVMMLTDYLKATGDMETVRKGLPLIKYCLAAQHSVLSNGMIPFNGDETYIAGGLLPRSAINDGSMEATSIYHESILRVLAIKELVSGLGTELIVDISRDLQLITEGFGKHFTGPEGQLYCNDPDSGYAPPFRPGGVLNCSHGFGIGYRDNDGNYVCPKCFAAKKGAGLKPEPGLEQWLALNGQGEGQSQSKSAAGNGGKRYVTEAAVLSPAFTVADSLIPVDKIREAAEKTLEELPRRSKTVGYEPGFIMYCLGYNEKLASEMLSMRDEFGSFSEYYEGGNQAGTLCRPWETAIDLAALLET